MKRYFKDMLGPFASNLVVLRLFMKFELMAPKVKVSLKVFVGLGNFEYIALQDS